MILLKIAYSIGFLGIQRGLEYLHSNMRALLNKPAHGDRFFVGQSAADHAFEMLGPFYLTYPCRMGLIANDHGVLVQVLDVVYVYR